MQNNHPSLYRKLLLPIAVSFLCITALVPQVSGAYSESPFLVFFSGNIQGETEPCG